MNRQTPHASSHAPPAKPPHKPPSREPRKPRADGAEARLQLLWAALRLFSGQGFNKTSTREIALAAGTNIASISYYFGDKAGLYRAVFRELPGASCAEPAHELSTHTALRPALQTFIAGFLDPMKQGDFAQQILRLHFREMLEPTGLWAEQIDLHIRPGHVALVNLLAHHLQVPEDDDLHRLAFSIAGLAMHIFITRDVIDAIRPSLIASPEALDDWGVLLAAQAEMLVGLEAKRRRQSAAPHAKPTPTKTTKPAASSRKKTVSHDRKLQKS